jgi:hypothetical protein
MKNRLLFLLTISMVFECNFLYSQGFMPPSEGKAVVYFVRPKGYNNKYEYQFFHNDKFIGEMMGGNYFRYECDPGKQLFWTVCENHKYMEADLIAGKTYIVKAFISTGAFKMRVFWGPVKYSEKERFEESRGMITTMAPYVPVESDLLKMNKKLSKMIKANLDRYHSKKDGEVAVEILSADMAIPEEALK